MGNHYFGVVDFVLFISLLIMSTLIGIYSALKGKENSTTENYYFGNRKMSAIPLGMSISVTFISAVTVIGAPVESYLFGVVFSWIIPGYIIASAIACMYFVPFVYRLKISSIYEYLEMRFDRKVRVFCSAVTVVQMIFYMGVCVYIPALALSAVTPIEMKWTILITSSVCTFYTTLGGFKAVVWTDVVQTIIMFVGSFALMIQGTILVGGPQKVWDASVRGQRINIFKVSFDPTVRMSAVHCVFGQMTMLVAIIFSNQALAQRVMSCESPKTAKRALMFTNLPACVIFLLSIANGAVMYAYYEGCDPILSGEVQKFDQMIPNMMTEAFYNTPGLAGIFVAAACSGTLSTVSSGINSVSMVIMEDITPLIKKSISPRQKLWGGKICGALLGCLVTIIAFLAGHMGKTVVQVAASLVGAFAGPIFGAFIMGMFIPKANGTGALVGSATSCIICLWMLVGSAIYGLRPEKLQMLSRTTDLCDNVTLDVTNFTAIETITLNHTTPQIEVLPRSERPAIADYFYSVSFLYLAFVGTSVSVLIGCITSFITGFNDPAKLNPILFMPLISNKRFPSRMRKFFRFGVPEISEKQNGFHPVELEPVPSTESEDDADPERKKLCQNLEQ